MTSIIARLQYLAAAHGTRAALVLFVVAIALAGVGLSAPVPTQQTSVVTGESPVSVAQSTAVTVESATPAYEVGTELEDEPLYLRRAAPHPTVTETVSAPAGTTATVEVALVYRAQTEDDGVFWRSVNDSVATQVAFTEDAPQHAVDLPLNATAVGLHRNALQQEFGVVVLVEPVVAVTVAYELPSGESGTLTQTTPLSFTRQTYRVPTNVTTDENPQTRMVVQPDPDQSVSVAGVDLGTTTAASLLGVLACLVGAVGAVIGGTRWDETRLRETVTRQRFDAWITTVTGATGDLPADVRRTESLRGLVDAAIDRGGRVEYWLAQDVYVAELGDHTYAYVPNSTMASVIGSTPAGTPTTDADDPGENDDGSGHDGSGHDGSGHDGSGHDGSGHDGSESPAPSVPDQRTDD